MITRRGFLSLPVVAALGTQLAPRLREPMFRIATNVRRGDLVIEVARNWWVRLESTPLQWSPVESRLGTYAGGTRVITHGLAWVRVKR